MSGQPTTVFIDIAALSLYAFYAFFLGLVFWLNRESKREGYPLVSEDPSKPWRGGIEGFPGVPPPKVFLLPHGGTATTNQPDGRDLTGLLAPIDRGQGAPLEATGDAMRDGVGAASWVARSRT